MSADNGIYILQTKEHEGHQFRVTYASAIDNLGWTYENNGESTYEFVPTRIIEYFGGCKYTGDQDMAFQIAGKKLKSYPYVEYGIQLLKTDKSWGQIVREAKVLAVRELEIMKSNTDYHKYSIERLENALKIVSRKMCFCCGNMFDRKDVVKAYFEDEKEHWVCEKCIERQMENKAKELGWTKVGT